LARERECLRVAKFAPVRKVAKGNSCMRLVLWAVFFLVSNLLGVEAFKAAVTLPSDERLVPSLLTFPLIGLTAVSATRVVEAWRRRDDE
jgi:hypothetical protein